MAEKKANNVTMRVRIGESELEVTGPMAFVEKKISEFVELSKATPLARQSDTKGLPHSDVEAVTATVKPTSPAQLFRKFSARTDVDRTLLAGYYLEVHKKYENFTAAEAKEIIRVAKINPPKNTNDSVNANVKKGLMMSAGDKDGKRAFILTSDGEDTVKEML